MKVEMKENVMKAARVAGGVVVGLVIAGLGGLAFNNYQINSELLDSINGKNQEIARLKQDALKANSDVSAVQQSVKDLGEQVKKAEAENAELTAKVEALEAQVATFDALKKKYKIKE